MADPINAATEPAKGWRTLSVSIAIAAVGALQTALAAGGGGILPIPYVGPALVAVGFLMAYLRTMTDTPIGTK